MMNTEDATNRRGWSTWLCLDLATAARIASAAETTRSGRTVPTPAAERADRPHEYAGREPLLAK